MNWSYLIKHSIEHAYYYVNAYSLSNIILSNNRKRRTNFLLNCYIRVRTWRAMLQVAERICYLNITDLTIKRKRLKGPEGPQFPLKLTVSIFIGITGILRPFFTLWHQTSSSFHILVTMTGCSLISIFSLHCMHRFRFYRN